MGGTEEDREPAQQQVPPSPSWWRWGGFDLPDAGTPTPDRSDRPGLPRAARRLLLIAVAAAAVLAGTLVRLPLQVTAPDVVVPAADLVTVDSDDGTVQPTSGAYLLPQPRGEPTVLTAAIALLRRDQRVRGTTRGLITGVDPLDAALVQGRGVAPGRSTPDSLGLAATIHGPASRAEIALLLEAYDQVSRADLAAGRRILALGEVGPDGQLRCQPDQARTIEAAATIDVVITGVGCVAEAGLVAVLEAPTFADALSMLSDT